MIESGWIQGVQRLILCVRGEVEEGDILIEYLIFSSLYSEISVILDTFIMVDIREMVGFFFRKHG